jgi:hypothetical protein
MLLHSFSAKKYRATTALIGVDYTGDHGVAVTVPADALIQVVSGPCEDNIRMVDVLWEGRPVRMFARDIQDRCQRIFDEAAHS